MAALPFPLLAWSMPFGDARRVKEERTGGQRQRGSGSREPVEAGGCGHRTFGETIIW